MDLFQVPGRADGLKVEPSGAKVEGDRVKRENAENILAEDRDGTYICTVCIYTYILPVCMTGYINEILSVIQEGEMTTRAQDGEMETGTRGGE